MNSKEFNAILVELTKEDDGYEQLLASIALLFEGKSYEYIIPTLKRVRKDFKKSMKKNKL